MPATGWRGPRIANRSTAAIARSMATLAMTFEWVNRRRPTSQIPSSGCALEVGGCLLIMP